MEVSVQLHAPATLLPGICSTVPIGYKTGWTPRPVWTLWRKISCLHWESNPGRPALYIKWAIPDPDNGVDFITLYFDLMKNQLPNFVFWKKKMGMWKIFKISVRKRTASDSHSVVQLRFELGTAPVQVRVTIIPSCISLTRLHYP
jgi:hypothetical protein